ncbi:pleckstrin homology domain-containing family D member 1-like [Limulus polyphemus]|uniref:Pleckstrin homology domain-containing family D member 1-like n=1 Tax=Limulus polyphemus TaxID=6850 RepID=A0ABM1SYQ5_LIMPO|nr:pleckstrin homology domain-containing family D member 1-like [Limulus polyphemus]
MICGRISRRGFLKHKKMGDKNSENSDDHFTVAAKVQMTGILMKRPFGHHSNKWTKRIQHKEIGGMYATDLLQPRFFVVKDGFLLYYSENEKKMFEKKSCFNIHPKGVIPLGGSTVEPTSDASQPYLLRISSDEYISGHFVLAADCEMEREKWLNILQEASRIIHLCVFNGLVNKPKVLS